MLPYSTGTALAWSLLGPAGARLPHHVCGMALEPRGRHAWQGQCVRYMDAAYARVLADDLTPAQILRGALK